jgi:hypothetical protein
MVKIHQCELLIKDEDGMCTMQTMDVIEHAAKFWLVPEWRDDRVRKATSPARMVSLETLAHQRIKGADPEFLVAHPVPKYVFDGRIPREEADKYVVLERPKLVIPFAQLGR